jgi:hypothetical protein
MIMDSKVASMIESEFEYPFSCFTTILPFFIQLTVRDFETNPALSKVFTSSNFVHLDLE